MLQGLIIRKIEIFEKKNSGEISGFPYLFRQKKSVRIKMPLTGHISYLTSLSPGHFSSLYYILLCQKSERWGAVAVNTSLALCEPH
jgi:hypothetical protein